MSTYTSNIPKAIDDPSQSQLLLLNNFQALAEAIDLNHIDMSDVSQRGKHKFLQMPEQTAAPTTAIDEGALYTKEASSGTQLFWRNENSTTEQQITNLAPNTVAPNRDWSFADGLQLRFGIVPHSGISTPVTFSAAFSSNAFIVLLTPIGGAGLTVGWNAQSLNLTGFTMASSGASTGSFYYCAVGN